MKKKKNESPEMKKKQCNKLQFDSSGKTMISNRTKNILV